MTKIYYEWVIEEVDEHGDIHDVDHYDTLKEICQKREIALQGLKQGWKIDIALVRDEICEFEGLIDRSWAYLQNNYLGSHFSGGNSHHKIPRRFHAEVTKIFDHPIQANSTT